MAACRVGGSFGLAVCALGFIVWKQRSEGVGRVWRWRLFPLARPFTFAGLSLACLRFGIERRRGPGLRFGAKYRGAGKVVLSFVGSAVPAFLRSFRFIQPG